MSGYPAAESRKSELVQEKSICWWRSGVARSPDWRAGESDIHSLLTLLHLLYILEKKSELALPTFGSDKNDISSWNALKI